MAVVREQGDTSPIPPVGVPCSIYGCLWEGEKQLEWWIVGHVCTVGGERVREEFPAASGRVEGDKSHLAP